MDPSTLITLTLLAALAGTTGASADGGESFSHADWTAVLQRFVDARGRVDYRGLAADREVFDRYLRRIETVSPETDPELFPTRDHALAYYLNAYNALVFDGVLDRGPEPKSVWRGLISGLNFFVLRKVTVGGEKMSLKSLEDDLVRARFEDARIHAALNCASVGCPRLPREAFEGERLDAQLDAAMRELVGDERHCRVDPASRTVHLSKIFDWFEKDFLASEKARGNPDPNLLDYVNRYRADDERIPESYRVRFLDYDKGINKQ